MNWHLKTYTNIYQVKQICNEIALHSDHWMKKYLKAAVCSEWLQWLVFSIDILPHGYIKTHHNLYDTSFQMKDGKFILLTNLPYLAKYKLLDIIKLQHLSGLDAITVMNWVIFPKYVQSQRWESFQTFHLVTSYILEQENIPVGCVPSVAVAVGGGGLPGGVCVSQHALGQTPPPPRGQNSWHTLVKILPCRNYVADGNKLQM